MISICSLSHVPRIVRLIPLVTRTPQDIGKEHSKRTAQNIPFLQEVRNMLSFSSEERCLSERITYCGCLIVSARRHAMAGLWWIRNAHEDMNWGARCDIMREMRFFTRGSMVIYSCVYIQLYCYVPYVMS